MKHAIFYCKVASLGLLLCATVIAALAFAEAWTPHSSCFPSIAKSQFPQWLGCTMAVHEGLAGGLIAAAGALFAGWLAWNGIREQIEVDKSHLRETRVQRAEDVLKEARKELEAINRVVDFHAPYEHAFATAGQEPNGWLNALLKLAADGVLVRNYYDELPTFYERLSGPVEQLRGISEKFAVDTAGLTEDMKPRIRDAADGTSAAAFSALAEGINSFRSMISAATERVAVAEKRLEVCRTS